MDLKPRLENGVSMGEAAAIQAGAHELGVEVGSSVAELLVEFLDRVYRWNRRIRLTAVDRRDAVRLHILDSLALIPILPSGRRLADLGSGAGLPGVALAAAVPDLEVTLVENKRKRCAYLTETVGALGLANVRVIEADAARLPDGYGAYFDAVTARAFVAPPRLVELATPLLGSGGVTIVMAGGRSAAPVVPDSYEIIRETDFVLPGGPEARRILVLRPLLRGAV